MNNVINEYCVADYLKDRLEEIGVEQMFGVAGNYTAALLDTILADKETPITISGNANEICAGFAADAYARLKGVSALYVTYSVGAFSLLNTIAGSFVEQVPVILINGAPTNKEDQISKQTGLLYSHTTGYQFVDIHMFKPITVAAERITNAQQAPFQIDSAITAMLTQKRPIYFEVAEDVWRTPCVKPTGKLSSGVNATITISEAANAAKATINMMLKRPKSIFWAGVELQRYGLQDKFLALLDVINTSHTLPANHIHFVTSAMSKSVIAETHPWFEGCVTLKNEEIDTLVGDEGALIGIGAWTTGKDTGNEDIRSDKTILAAHDGVHVGAEFYPSVQLSDYLDQLIVAFSELEIQKNAPFSGLRLKQQPPLLATQYHAQNTLGYDNFYHTLGQWLCTDDIMVVDAGFPLIGAQSVKIPSQNGFVAQASWLSIGYSVPAGTGVKCAYPDKRAIVVVGDGAFHETCQAVADQHAYGQNTVVFVIANGIYGIEQYLVNPNPFRTPPVDYKDPLLDEVYPYNELPSWNIANLTDAFGGQGRKVSQLGELLNVMEEIRANPDTNFLVEVVIPKDNVPKSIAMEADTAVGEDEIDNPNWPPSGKF
ncbi:alpha-keto acid decarboxylase family protein [Pseudoalteromonas sp. MMG013]|uniref:Indolepyruvate decarboxylase n=1 Tax=Pseudoalteromonas aurantia 208 TaxID=1314867 RepID=A0ABR9EI21_9GAMM|nr:MULTISPECIES: thiamine pyrophosphate-binding protein [Pseudoalteromonas]MBE0370647.1 indolepyruvate decarboxylase [Pseudoalteromonas aurantia 208]MBQ4845221.1 alpha-keto acid decarboxylase family protein [Pseudoalteromonas sp. MMG005]MBQ4860593.1 alpha-keto acid decarboxylase family protein [Pseudoalteromonas sp. MMG013]